MALQEELILVLNKCKWFPLFYGRQFYLDNLNMHDFSFGTKNFEN